MSQKYPPGYFDPDPAERPTDEEVEAWQAARDERRIDDAEYDRAFG